MSAIHLLKFAGTGAGLWYPNLQNPMTLLLVQMAVGITFYGAIAGLSPISTYVEFRAHILSYFEHGIGRQAGGRA
jgi:hypothetical protein